MQGSDGWDGVSSLPSFAGIVGDGAGQRDVPRSPAHTRKPLIPLRWLVIGLLQSCPSATLPQNHHGSGSKSRILLSPFESRNGQATLESKALNVFPLKRPDLLGLNRTRTQKSSVTASFLPGEDELTVVHYRDQSCPVAGKAGSSSLMLDHV